MPKSSLFFGAVATMAIVAIAAGLYMIGGPSFARQDRFDAKRLSEITHIVTAMLCSERKEHKTPLPESLSDEAIHGDCAASRIRNDALLDPETSKPYSYRKIDKTDFEVCATFYDAARAWKRSIKRLNRGANFDANLGCLRGSRF